MAIEAETVRANLAVVHDAVAEAARRSGRDAGSVEILAATKYVDAGDLPALHEAGIRLVGENRTDSLQFKQERFADLFTWDFIGHLQSRKVRDVIGRVRLIHSIGSLSACQQVQARAEAPVACLLEVNLAAEESKSGVTTGELDALLTGVEPLEHVRFAGLMTMPPLAIDPEQSRAAFAALRELAVRLRPRWQGRHDLEHLSMGTSQDFTVAVEEGATIVRIGSVLYGRPAG